MLRHCTYDPVGNRLSSLGVSSYTNNSSNELTSTSNASYTYDNNGNTHTKVVGSNTTTYAWDYENRMTSVTLPGSGGTVSFKYDPFGRRIYKSFSAGTTSIYAFDGDNLIEETNSSGAVVARYEDTQNIDEPLAMLRSSATSYFHADGLGSITSLSSAAGSIANTYTYDSYGNLTASTGSLTNSFRYTGREFDSETGLYYYRARYYDPTAGRFLGSDPMKFSAGMNFYSYVHNRPTKAIDPYGLFTGNLGGTFSCQIGPFNFSYSGGVIFGSDASIGVYNTGSGGVGIGGGCFFGLTAGISTARSICGFGGPFSETGESSGIGVGESASVFSGVDSDGVTPVAGGSVTAGIGGGGSVYTGITLTHITPLFTPSQGSNPCGCE